MGVASRVADYAQIPALHEGRGMVAGRRFNVPVGVAVPGPRDKIRPAVPDLTKETSCVNWSQSRGDYAMWKPPV